jgi:hypothetical protein
MLRYNDTEWAVLVQVAALDGKTPGAWAQQAAYEAALRAHLGEPSDRGALITAVNELTREIREHRRVLANVGGNLNDVARHANATGDLGIAATTVLRLIRNVVLASDTLVIDVRRKLLP